MCVCAAHCAAITSARPPCSVAACLIMSLVQNEKRKAACRTTGMWLASLPRLQRRFAVYQYLSKSSPARDDFTKRGSVSRSTWRATDALGLSKGWPAGKGSAGHRPALLWLRLRRAALYRRFLTCQLLPASNALPITNRRHTRLKIFAPLREWNNLLRICRVLVVQLLERQIEVFERCGVIIYQCVSVRCAVSE